MPGGTRVTACPSSRTVPSVAPRSPHTTRSSVLFPHPLGPRMATNSPGATRTDTPDRARFERCSGVGAGKRTETASTSILGTPAAVPAVAPGPPRRGFR